MRHKLPFLTCIFFLAILISGCEKCIQNQVAELMLTDEDLAINPYAKEDTLVFEDSFGDSATMWVDYRQSSVQSIYYYSPEDAKLYHNGCEGDYYIYEGNSTQVNSDNSNSSIQIVMAFLFNFENPTSGKYIRFSIHFQGLACYSSYGFEPETIYSLNFATGSDHDSVAGYYPSIVIGNKTFEGVYELYCFNYFNSTNERIETIYYSFSKGIVGFKSNLGRTWNLGSLSSN